MRIKSLLLTALAATFLASCAKDEHLGDGGEGNPNLDPSGDNYISVALSFAGDASTRADGGFDKGEGAESKISNIKIYFFDSTLNLLGDDGVEVRFGSVEEGTTEGIDKEIEVTVPADVITTLQADEKCGVLAVINENITYTDKKSYGDMNGKQTLADILALTDENGFMMTNSNYMVAATNTEAALVPITTANIGKKVGGKPVDGQNLIQVVIPVERVVAKVSLAKAESVNSEILGWGLNVTNKKYFPVKMLTPGFLTATGMDMNATVALDSKYTTANWGMQTSWNDDPHKRSYWAVDPNYTKVGTGKVSKEDFDLLNLTTDVAKLKGVGESLYCLENTFNEDNQLLSATTTAVVIAQYLPKDVVGGDFPTTDKTWVKWGERNYLPAEFIKEFIKENNADLEKYYYTTNTVTERTQVTADCFELVSKTPNAQEIKKDASGSVIGYEGGMTLAWTHEGATIYLDNADGAAVANGEEAIKAAITEALDRYEVAIYKGGYSYYEIPIMHFDEVPWNAEPYKPQHLGRYGIVRNNSYQLTINKIENPGKPIEGGEIEPEPDPDDKLEQYLSVKIEVLSWKVRIQGVDL